DELPLFALAASHARGESVVKGARELRVKETDRIETVTNSLRALGVRITASEDGFRIRGVPARPRGGAMASSGDHRIAMLGAVAGENPIALDEDGRVWIDDTDVTAAIRKSRIDRVVPVVARHPEVRAIMRARQRELAEVGDAVIEGRDIGTVVCPGADVKVYLNAERQTRAERRLAERPEIGADALATDLRLRDQSDAERMMPADDAI